MKKHDDIDAPEQAQACQQQNVPSSKRAARKERKEARKKRKRDKRRKRGDRISPITVIGVLFGMVLLSYPFLADWNANRNAENAVNDYAAVSYGMTQEEKDFLLAQADAYNKLVAGDASEYEKHPEYSREYQDQLTTDSTGCIGTLEIPKHGILQPIYKGTSEDVLMSGVGHLDRTSLPIGGTSTHAMVSGHTGMPGQRMFDDVHDMVPGDIVKISVLDRVIYYQMDKAMEVDPGFQTFDVTPGESRLTLVTCTPYGINDHRLLVECHQIDYTEEQVKELEEQAVSRIDAYINIRTIPFIIATCIVLLFGVVHVARKIRKRHKAKKPRKTAR